MIYYLLYNAINDNLLVFSCLFFAFFYLSVINILYINL